MHVNNMAQKGDNLSMSLFRKPFIRNNEALKTPGFREKITKEEHDFRVKEIVMCRQDPAYFAEKYFTIVSPKKGQHIIKMYDKQRQLVQTMVDKNRIVTLASRQVGKCQLGTSKIKIRNKITGEIQELTIEEFTDLHSSRQDGKEC